MFQGIAKKQQPYFKFDPLIDSLFTNEETGLCTEALEPIKAREGPFTFHELICRDLKLTIGILLSDNPRILSDISPLCSVSGSSFCGRQVSD